MATRIRTLDHVVTVMHRYAEDDTPRPALCCFTEAWFEDESGRWPRAFTGWGLQIADAVADLYRQSRLRPGISEQGAEPDSGGEDVINHDTVREQTGEGA